MPAVPTSRALLTGLDLGKVQDPSVLVLTECVRYYLGLYLEGEIPSYVDDRGEYHPSKPKHRQVFRTVYIPRYIEPFPLELPYFEQATRCADILGGVRRDLPTMMFIDATGVGQGVIEIVRECFNKRQDVRHVKLQPVTLTYGRQEYSWSTQTVSKHALVSRLLKLMGAEEPELQMPADLQQLMPALDELRNFQERISAETANQSYGGASGVHDDIVIALGLSVLVDPSTYQVKYSARIY